MEQSERADVKSLRAMFQNDEHLKTRFKPAIPDKPKTLTSPSSKISNPLLAAMENRMPIGPRVVFKEKNKNQHTPQSETSPIKAKPPLLDMNQKKEGDLIKEALKDKKSPLNLLQNLEETSKTELSRTSPITLKNFTKGFNDENVKSKSPQLEQIASVINKRLPSNSSPPSLDYQLFTPKAYAPPVQVNRTIPGPETTFSPTVTSKNPVSQFPLGQAVSAPVVSSLSISASTATEPKVRHLTPESKPDRPTTLNYIVAIPEPQGYLPEMQDDGTSHNDPDLFEMDIPPPIIPDDFPDFGSPVQDTSFNFTPEPLFPVTSPIISDSSGFGFPHIASPGMRSYTFMYPRPSVSTVSNPADESTYGRSPAPNFEPTEDRRAADFSNLLNPQDVSSPALSALARAEEKSPVKHNPVDQLLLNLLNKSKQKTPATSSSSIPLEFLPPGTDPFELPERFSTSPSPHADIPETSMALANSMLIDHEDKSRNPVLMMYNNETELLNHHGELTPQPRTVMVQKPAEPPAPPPRKQLPQSEPITELPPDKPPMFLNTDIQRSVLQDPYLEAIGSNIPVPEEFTSDNSPFENTSQWDSQAEDPGVHEQAFSEIPDVEHQAPEVDVTDLAPQRTITPGIPYSLPDSSFSPAIPFPAGNLRMPSNSDEDLTDRKTKTQKKTKKSLLNPYADASPATEDTPKKALFSKKNSVSDERDLKIKEKQKQKDKEKEKEKKEQKEKEKKELKEKKKEKEKDKKKEEKERDKKELKEKEKEKKEQKEKEKKEHEIKKRFRISGEEEVIYQATVMESSKGRKDDLAVKVGDFISIMRTTDCPKGKWLARDTTNKYGYIPLENVKLDIQDMLKMGNKNKPANNGTTDIEVPTNGSRPFNHFNFNQESFTDDSEEWGDEDDTPFTPTEIEPNQRIASPWIVSPHPTQPAQVYTPDHVQPKHEALQKLSTFFMQPPPRSTMITEPEPAAAQEPDDSLSREETDFQFVPPPDMYADISLQ